MSLSTRTLVIGSHAWFALSGATLSDSANVIKPSGDATSYTTVAKTAKPSATDTAWVKLGVISSVVVDPGNQTPIEIREPSPGRLLRASVLRVGPLPKLTVTCKEVQPLALQALFRTLALTGSSSQFNPGELTKEIMGWLKLQQYDHTDTGVVNLDWWTELSVDAMTFDPTKETDVTFQLLPCASPLNTGGL